MGISVVINTYNEEKNISNVIRSVRGWTDEIIVVDMYSHDKTVAIAKSLGASVFLHENLGFADPARSFAIDKAQHNWILMLDADEMVPYELSIILKNIMLSDRIDVVRIPWINYLFGKHIKYTGWGGHQDKHVRFFRKGCVTANGKIHNFLHLSEKARVLDLDLDKSLGVIHFNYRDIDHFIEKTNRYTNIESLKIDKITPKFYLQMILVPVLEFVKRFIYRKGYKDGTYGLILSFMMMFYKFLSYAKAYQRLSSIRNGKSSAVYSSIAEKIIEEYESKKI